MTAGELGTKITEGFSPSNLLLQSVDVLVMVEAMAQADGWTSLDACQDKNPERLTRYHLLAEAALCGLARQRKQKVSTDSQNPPPDAHFTDTERETGRDIENSESSSDRSAFIIVYGAVALSGGLVGFLLGWLLRG